MMAKIMNRSGYILGWGRGYDIIGWGGVGTSVINWGRVEVYHHEVGYDVIGWGGGMVSLVLKCNTLLRDYTTLK